MESCNPPDILYKYSSFENTQKILKSGELKITPLHEFNDPFEFLIAGVTGFSVNDEDTIKVKNALIKNALISGKIQTWEEGEERIDKHVAARGGYEKLENQDPKEYRKYVLGRVLCLCLCEEWNNILMWSHYSDNHSGIVIGFDPKLLNKSWLQVKYSNNRFKIPYDEYFLEELIYTKSKHWEYEKEWRAIYFLRKERDRRSFKFPVKALREVIIGAEAPPEKRKEITELVQKNYSAAKIKQAELSPDRFALDINELT